MTKPRVLSGMQPSGDSLHLGNYLGALVNWVKTQDDYDAFFFIPDMHAITAKYDPADLKARTRKTAAQFIAGGIDVDRSTLFVQSQVPEHAQLAWVLNCITGFGEASRMTQFKDKSAKGGVDAANVGLFTYPVLMAADILLYQPQGVPVGDDQRQNVELTRTLAQRFNHRFGETFVVPEAQIPAEGARAYDKQEKPGVSNLLDILAAVTDRHVPELVAEFEGKMYGHLKVAVADAVVERLTPIRTRTLELLDDPAELDRLLLVGAEKARGVASKTVADVYEKVGFLPPLGV